MKKCLGRIERGERASVPDCMLYRSAMVTSVSLSPHCKPGSIFRSSTAICCSTSPPPLALIAGVGFRFKSAITRHNICFEMEQIGMHVFEDKGILLSRSA